MKKIYSILLCFLLIGCTKTFSYVQMTMEEAQQRWEKESGYIIVDVRNESEYMDGHIPEAILLENEEVNEKAEMILKDKDQIIYVYCRSGNRSKQAAEKLIQLGYKNVIEIGGIIDYRGRIE